MEVNEDIIDKQPEKAEDSAEVLPGMSDEEVIAEPATSAQASEEIDDVEPHSESGAKKDLTKDSIDPVSLLSSGISITVIDRKKKVGLRKTSRKIVLTQYPSCLVGSASL